MSRGINGPTSGSTLSSRATSISASATGMSSPSSADAAASSSSSTSSPPSIRQSLGKMEEDTMIGVTCMLLMLCLMAVGGRLIARRIAKQLLKADDYLAIGALVLFIGLAVETFLIAHYTASAPRSSAVAVHMVRLAQLVFASQVTYTFIMATARISLLFLYRRIFNLRLLWFRIAWWCCTAYVSLYCIVQFIGYVAQCRPRPTQNSPTDPNINLCGHRGLQVAVMGYNNAAIDLVILVLPIRMVWTLQMTRRQKVAVGGVFALGLIGVAVSLVRAVYSTRPSVYLAGGLSGFAIWTVTEPAVAIICACLPCMRPLVHCITNKNPSTRHLSNWSWARFSTNSSSRRYLGSDSSTKQLNQEPKTPWNPPPPTYQKRPYGGVSDRWRYIKDEKGTSLARPIHSRKPSSETSTTRSKYIRIEDMIDDMGSLLATPQSSLTRQTSSAPRPSSSIHPIAEERSEFSVPIFKAPSVPSISTRPSLKRKSSGPTLPSLRRRSSVPTLPSLKHKSSSPALKRKASHPQLRNPSTPLSHSPSMSLADSLSGRHRSVPLILEPEGIYDGHPRIPPMPDPANHLFSHQEPTIPNLIPAPAPQIRSPPLPYIPESFQAQFQSQAQEPPYHPKPLQIHHPQSHSPPNNPPPPHQNQTQPQLQNQKLHRTSPRSPPPPIPPPPPPPRKSTPTPTTTGKTKAKNKMPSYARVMLAQGYKMNDIRLKIEDEDDKRRGIRRVCREGCGCWTCKRRTQLLGSRGAKRDFLGGEGEGGDA